MPTSPFSAGFLTQEWPLLCEACSLPRNAAHISALAARVRDWDSLFRLTADHGVIAQLAVALGERPSISIPSEFVSNLRERHRLQVLFTLAMTAELFRTLGMLHEAGVETVLVKGPVLSLRAYGDPAARRYSDLDLVVRHAQIGRAAKILIDAGFESKISAEAIEAGKIPGEYVFRRPGQQVIVELHTERSLRYFPRPLPLEAYFARKAAVLLDGHEIPALSPEDEFVLICIHGTKHFWERLTWISDIAAIVHNRHELNWDRVSAAAREVGASRMVRAALLLAERVLRVPVPQAMKREVSQDTTCEPLVRRIETWLPFSGYAAPPFATRARFRFQMSGGLLSGAGYLARLSVSTTEEDWANAAAGRSSSLGEILRRPFRLARKYRRTER